MESNIDDKKAVLKSLGLISTEHTVFARSIISQEIKDLQYLIGQELTRLEKDDAKVRISSMRCIQLFGKFPDPEEELRKLQEKLEILEHLFLDHKLDSYIEELEKENARENKLKQITRSEYFKILTLINTQACLDLFGPLTRDYDINTKIVIYKNTDNEIIIKMIPQHLCYCNEDLFNLLNKE